MISLGAESDEEDFQGPGDSHLTRILKECVDLHRA